MAPLSPRKGRRFTFGILRRLRKELLQLKFYRVHMAYFLITILISSAILYGSDLVNKAGEAHRGHLEYIDALFLCTSAMTATGRLAAAYTCQL